MMKISVHHDQKITGVHSAAQFLAALSIIAQGVTAIEDHNLANDLVSRLAVPKIPTWQQVDPAKFISSFASEVDKTSDAASWEKRAEQPDFLVAQALLVRKGPFKDLELSAVTQGSDEYVLADTIGGAIEWLEDLLRRAKAKVQTKQTIFLVPEFKAVVKERTTANKTPTDSTGLSVAYVGVKMLEDALVQAKATDISVQRDHNINPPVLARHA
jgi:hypothetical protein